MTRNKTKELFGTKNFVMFLTVWLMLNSIKFISTNPLSQIISIGFGLWGVLVIFLNIFSEERTPFKVNGTGLAIPFILAVLLSFVGNGFISPVKNLYSVIAVSINFLVLYTYAFVASKEDFRKIMFIILVGTTLINTVNILLLLFRISIQTGDLSDIKQVTFIGYDSLRGRMTGLSGNANGLSRVALCGVIASSYFLIVKDKIQRKYLYVIATIINMIVLITSQSRAGIYSISAAVGLIVIVYIFKVKESTIGWKVFSIIFSVVLTFSSIKILNKAGNFTAENFPSIQMMIKEEGKDENSLNGLIGRDDDATKEDSSNGRLTLMKNGISATMKYNPLFGLSYSNATNRVSEYIEEENISIPDHLKTTVGSMHNTIVQSFVYYGFLGLIPLTVFFLYIAIVFIRYLTSKLIVKKENKKTLLFITFVIGIMVPMNMVEWIFVFDFDNHLINMIMFIVLGLFIRIVQTENESLLKCTVDGKIRDFTRQLILQIGGKK